MHLYHVQNLFLKIAIDCRSMNILIKVKYRVISGQVLFFNKPIPHFKGESMCNLTHFR